MSENWDSSYANNLLIQLVLGIISISFIKLDNNRNYIQKNYQQIKELNPELPFIVRECKNAQPTIMARYDFGIEKRMYVNNLQENEIDEVVRELVQ